MSNEEIASLCQVLHLFWIYRTDFIIKISKQKSQTNKSDTNKFDTSMIFFLKIEIFEKVIRDFPILFSFCVQLLWIKIIMTFGFA